MPNLGSPPNDAGNRAKEVADTGLLSKIAFGSILGAVFIIFCSSYVLGKVWFISPSIFSLMDVNSILLEAAPTVSALLFVIFFLYFFGFQIMLLALRVQPDPAGVADLLQMHFGKFIFIISTIVGILSTLNVYYKGDEFKILDMFQMIVFSVANGIAILYGFRAWKSYSISQFYFQYLFVSLLAFSSIPTVTFFVMGSRDAINDMKKFRDEGFFLFMPDRAGRLSPLIFAKDHFVVFDGNRYFVMEKKELQGLVITYCSKTLPRHRCAKDTKFPSSKGNLNG
jgi:hypothetical protein